MRKSLRRDIYSLNYPRFSIKDLVVLFLDQLASIRYSCAYWVNYLYDISHRDFLIDSGLVYKFL